MKRRIYTDTSVVGGCLDKEFQVHSNELFRRFREGLDILVLSDVTLTELESAPSAVREVLKSVPDDTLEEIRFDQDAAELAKEYIVSGVIGASHLEDARHIATATIHRVDILVSWNFRHIVNLDRIHGYNSVNLRLGHILLEIRTPQEILRYEED